MYRGSRRRGREGPSNLMHIRPLQWGRRTGSNRTPFPLRERPIISRRLAHSRRRHAIQGIQIPRSRTPSRFPRVLRKTAQRGALDSETSPSRRCHRCSQSQRGHSTWARFCGRQLSKQRAEYPTCPSAKLGGRETATIVAACSWQIPAERPHAL